MSLDAGFRRASRSAAASSDRASESDAFASAVRSGETSAARCRLLALLGHQPAVDYAGRPAEPRGSAAWFSEVVRATTEAGWSKYRPLVAVARAVIATELKRASEAPEPEVEVCECPWRGADHFDEGFCRECHRLKSANQYVELTADVAAAFSANWVVEGLESTAMTNASAVTESDPVRERLLVLHATEFTPPGFCALLPETILGGWEGAIVAGIMAAPPNVDAVSAITSDLLPLALGAGDPLAERVSTRARKNAEEEAERLALEARLGRLERLAEIAPET